ncbi:DUF2726 domain-containing protein [Micromonospora sp. NPDC050417]|uniref:DUF2726 domain-containing protein n=1 Tax=Micromonospora sp. NPDC050417 TaxID=3364280 RepID=UPI0037A8C426
MVDTGIGADLWLRPISTPSEHPARLARGEVFERGGCVVQPDWKLSQITRRRPPGITAHQWSSAIRTQLAFVVGDPYSFAPTFAVEVTDKVGRGPEVNRDDRMTNAVCAAVGLQLMRVESATLRGGGNGRRIVDYVLDARAFRDTAEVDEADSSGAAPLSYRDIVGRLPDGRSGYVNDLGAVARAAAVDAYASRQLADPIIRSLYVSWADGPAEGWAWLEVRAGHFFFERVRLWEQGFSCGVDPGRLVEDLAVAAVGEQLKRLGDAEPVLYARDQLGRDLAALRARQDELADGFAFAHISFD